MAEIEEALTTYLLAQTGLTALIDRRFFFEELPQGTELPAVVCIKISDVKDHFLTEQSSLERPMIQFTAHASTKAGARTVSNQLKTALCDYTGTLSGIFVQLIRLENELSSLEKSSDGTTKTYTEDLEFEVIYEKE